MDDGLKQRIVGAIVLVAIGVVFVPVVFDRERIEPMDRKSLIPPAPSIKPVAINPPKKPSNPKPVKNVKDTYVPKKEQQVKETDLKTKKPVIGVSGTPNSWVLQIASYRFEGHAKQRRDQLLEKGYTAFTRNVETKQGKMTRLFVGPNLQKSKIVAAKKAIDKMLGVETVVMRFEP